MTNIEVEILMCDVFSHTLLYLAIKIFNLSELYILFTFLYLSSSGLGDTCATDDDCASVDNAACFQQADVTSFVCECRFGYRENSFRGCDSTGGRFKGSIWGCARYI